MCPFSVLTYLDRHTSQHNDREAQKHLVPRCPMIVSAAKASTLPTYFAECSMPSQPLFHLARPPALPSLLYPPAAMTNNLRVTTRSLP